VALVGKAVLFIARGEGYVSIPLDRLRRAAVTFEERQKSRSPACVVTGRFCDR
jgi:hypothetical protein